MEQQQEPYAAPIQTLTLEFLAALSESKLQQRVVEPLLRRLGFSNVRNTSGPNEAGKDLLAVQSEFGRSKLYAIQIKKLKFSGKSGAPNSLYRVLEQLQQMMTEPAIDPTNNTRRVPDRGLFITPHTIPRNAMETALGRVRELERREVTIIDGPLLADQVALYIPEVLLQESPELRYRYEAARLSDRVAESTAFGLAQPLSLDDVFVDIGVSISFVRLAELPRRRQKLPGPQVTEASREATRQLASEWRHWSRGKPRIWRPPRGRQPLSQNSQEVEIDLDPVLEGVRRKASAAVAEFRSITAESTQQKLNRVVKKEIELRHRLVQLSRIEGLTDAWPMLDLSRASGTAQVVAHTSVRSLLRIQHPVFLTGGAGAGKTTILRRLCQLVAREVPRRIPLLIYLSRVRGNSERNLLKTCREELRSLNYELSYKDLVAGLRKGRFHILLDGLDEAGARGAELMKSIVSLSARYRQCPLVVSCRDSFPHLEWERALHLVVPPFDSSAVSTFLERWFDAQPTAAEALRAWLRENPEMKAAARTPVVLALLCSLYHADADLPSSEVELYEGRFDLLLGRWDKAKGGSPLPPQLKKKYLHFLMMLAFELHRHVSRTGQPEMVEKLAREFFSKKYHGRPAGLIEDCVLRGLLFRDEKGLVSLGHLTYQEFLVGRRLAHDNPIDTIIESLTEPWWWKSLQFYAAIMGDLSLLINQVLLSVREKPIGGNEKVLLRKTASLLRLAPLTTKSTSSQLHEMLRNLKEE